MERSESLGHYEMLWDCEYCGTQALLAKSQRHCANCGGKQNPDKRYFPKEGEEKKVDGHRFEGKDRYCPSCAQPMGASALNCTNCGSALEGGTTVKPIAAPVKQAPKPTTNRKKIILIVSIIALVIFAIWWFFIRTKEAQMTVTAHSWSRVIGIEEWGEEGGEAWRDSVPPRAKRVFCSRRERSTRQVDTGQEDCRVEKKDNGDGTFEQVKKCKPIYRSEPVDDDWCTYAIDTWREVDALKTGGSDMNPVWPVSKLPASAPEIAGTRKQGRRTETLKLQFGSQSCDVSDAVWRKYTNGQKVKLEVRARSGDIVCGSL